MAGWLAELTFFFLFLVVNTNEIGMADAETEADFEEMLARARAFYGRPGGDRFLGPELPRWFFVFLLRFCALFIAIRRARDGAAPSVHRGKQREEDTGERARLVAAALEVGLDDVD